MRKFFITIFIITVSGIIQLHAQDAGGGDQAQQPEVGTKKALEEKKQAELKEKQAEEESREQHIKDQTPAVRKRMKKDAHKADMYNGHKQEFFLKRWFEKKHA